MPLGSNFLQSCVDFAATPKPNGTSAMENTTTPSPAAMLSVILPNALFKTWFPYKKDISDCGLSHTLCLALAASKFRAWTVRWKLPPWVYLPMQVPSETRLGRATLVARLTRDSLA
ncbi:hypothetical protein V8G54_016521 [Vigna mungo]|uniref:Uncharacterized protein n=1 Tax=Vigna mungo TaxID=3915 RepID=A0AAQ3NN94_VIGMU